MFGRKKNASEPIYDATQKIKKTWWGDIKLVPTTKAEQRKMKAEILKQNPKVVVLDSNILDIKFIIQRTKLMIGLQEKS